jgi:hypothetical protein
LDGGESWLGRSKSVQPPEMRLREFWHELARKLRVLEKKQSYRGGKMPSGFARIGSAKRFDGGKSWSARNADSTRARTPWIGNSMT